ncbi:MAG: S-ribosylhomocysteine lyase [Finegoldia sp.]|nr:S-ribosylhomocysteine lyase [Finegoldia sp.]
MRKIDSFSVNHLDLLPGIYVSRKDYLEKDVLTTFDLRITRPNLEPVMNTAEVHAIEHIGATYLRNRNDFKDSIIYFGPMGCRTGFYLIIAKDLQSKDVLDLILDLFEFIAAYDDEIPGRDPKECGNYQDMNLDMAKYYAKKYLEVLKNITEENLIYPQ